ncbi:MAG: hypothetical protein DME23_08145 [Verrucomicrobia bacterium]|nr:MAG: hypothetical protein DME23_08145 [Verrucomicrobiota bacterium]
MRIVRLLLFTVCLSTLNQLCAQVPQLINFQGRVAVDGVNFNGSGEFKFALVNGDGSSSFWSNDGSSANGNEPSNAVPIAVSQGLYAVLLGDATLTNMTPISAAIFTNSDVRLRIWFNDGANGFQQLSPDQRIAAVGYAMMSANVADGVVTSAKLADGAVTSGKLAVGAVTATSIAPHSIGSAQLATNAAADSLHDSGGLVLSDQSNATNLLNSGYVRIGQVTTDVDYWRQVGPSVPTPRWGHSAVWTGSEMIVWGGLQFGMSGNLNTGAIYNPVTDTWNPIATKNAPTARMGHTAVWTGSEMIVSGGIPFSQAGGRYNPSTDQWRTTSRANAPTVYADYRAVWTGTEMFVWGGPNLGRRYNPAADSWRNISPLNAPTSRSAYTVVWTGSRMVIWGGIDDAGPTQTGGIYDPASDSWSTTTTNGAPAPRYSHTVINTGNEMIIWGGQAINYFNTGSRYNPETDRWLPISVVRAPTARSAHTAIWTGAEMIIWGGRVGGSTLATGGRYDPGLDRWLTLSTNGAPSPRTGHSMVWSRNEAICWGGTTLPGQDSARGIDTGGRYDPATDSWKSPAIHPAGRIGHTAVWTGSEMIIWGGINILSGNSQLVSPYLGTGGRFNPVTATWSPVSTNNAPTPRLGHTAVWTGDEMIVWGGFGMPTNSPIFLNRPTVLGTGGRYNPTTDQWRLTEPNGAPTARVGHTAVWTGKEIIVWGGISTNREVPTTFLNTGARYDPVIDSWTTITSTGAPSARTNHTAVWTGKEMIVWGGFGPVTNNNLRLLNTGGRYDPTRNTWTNLPVTGAPPAIVQLPLAVWTGHEMIIWFGRPYHDPPYGFGFGGRYRPDKDSWSPIYWDNAGGIPLAGLWTGNEMIVWDGQFVGRYDPTFDGWTRRTLPGAPAPRTGATAVWTGNSMLLFGGGQSANFKPIYPGDVYAYSLTRPMYLYQKP